MSSRIENMKNILLGKEFETSSCGRCSVVDYKGRDKVFVKFYEYPNIVKCNLSNLKKGLVSNPMRPTLRGVGYMGVGNYTSNDKLAYQTWNNMLERSYSEKCHQKQPAYKDTIVCDEWLNFQNFAKWCYSQDFFNAKDDKGKVYQLDKDILVKGNKTYSPETCCFVPKDINVLLLKSRKTRGDCLIGVTFNKNSGKFVTRMGVTGISCYIKQSVTEDEAFETYKKVKEAHIKLVAEKWKSVIDDKVYQSLLNYKICRDD